MLEGVSGGSRLGGKIEKSLLLLVQIGNVPIGLSDPLHLICYYKILCILSFVGFLTLHLISYCENFAFDLFLGSSNFYCHCRILRVSARNEWLSTGESRTVQG